ncbi:MAG: peptidylprolyl isomerase [Chitinivorax sp.]
MPFSRITALLMSAGLLLASPAHAAPQPADRIVAVVNKQAITANELNDRVKTVMRNLQAQNVPLPPANILRQQVLERLVSEAVQMQLAQDTGIRIDDNQLDRSMERIAQQNNMSLAQFRAALEKDGMDFRKFREDIRTEIALSRLREREVDSRVIVSDAEVDNLQQQQKAKSQSELELNISHVLVQVPENASPIQVQERRARAEKALADLEKGAKFAQIAASYSDAQDALQGGSLGWRPSGRIPALFLEQLEKLQPGQHTSIIRSANGFHIIQLNEKRAKNEQIIVQQTHARHILIRTNEAVSSQDAYAAILRLRERIANGGDFEEVARIHSEDGSAPRGGDLGWLGPGDTVPEFEKVMDSLKVGELSEPVKSPFGWHLIRVEERRSADVSSEREKLQVRQSIRARKADENFDDWLRQLRDKAYVEIRAEEP